MAESARVITLNHDRGACETRSSYSLGMEKHTKCFKPSRLECYPQSRGVLTRSPKRARPLFGGLEFSLLPAWVGVYVALPTDQENGPLPVRASHPETGAAAMVELAPSQIAHATSSMLLA